MSKSIVIITAHCDDDEKINMLVDCINEISSQGYSIIVSTSKIFFFETFHVALTS